MRSARSVSLALALVAGLLEQLIFAYHSSLGALSDQHLQPEQGVQGPLVRKENSPASAVVLAPPWADAETSAAEVSADGGVRTDSDLSWRREHQHHHQSWAKQGEELLHGVPSSPRASSSGKTSFEGPSRASSTSSTSLEGSTRKGRSSSGTTEQGRSTGGVGARNDDSTGGNGARSDVSTGGDKESRRASLSGTSSSDTTSSLQNDKEEDHSGKRTRRTTSERTETRVDPPTTADNDLNSAPIDDGTTTSDPVDGLDQASAQATNTTTTTPLMPDFQNTAGDCVYASLSSCNTGLSAGYNHSSWVTSQQNASDEDMMNFTNTTNPEANRVFVARFKGSATATDQHLTLGDCCFYQGQAKIGFESAQTGLSSRDWDTSWAMWAGGTTSTTWLVIDQWRGW